MLQNVDVDSIAASTSAPRSTTRRGNSRSRRTCVTTSLVGIAFVLLLLGVSCVPLVLYFVEKGIYNLKEVMIYVPYMQTPSVNILWLNYIALQWILYMYLYYRHITDKCTFPVKKYHIDRLTKANAKLISALYYVKIPLFILIK